MRMKAATKISIIVTLCLLYAAAYGAARSKHWLIHRVGYYSDTGENRKVGRHYISSGDLGSPMLAPRISIAQGLATIFFWPATQAELVYWYLVQPRDSPWQKT
jgi:hypothetical protein